jgi:hypothetical protein
VSDRNGGGEQKPRSYDDTVEQQADFEGLVREKDDFEEAVEAEAKGEEPRREEDKSVSGT